MRAFAVILVVLLVLAGCAKEPAAGPASTSEVEVTTVADPTSTVTKAPTTKSVTTEGGGVYGTVTDLEFAPLESVVVTLLEFEAEATTDTTGRYAFTDVPGGEYQLTFEHPAYETEGRKVGVEVGKDARLDVVLERLPFDGPRQETFSYTGFIQAGEAFADLAPCEQGVTECYYWFNSTGPGLNTVVIEADWEPTLPGNPIDGARLYMQVSGYEGSPLYKDGYLPPGGKQQFQGDWPQDTPTGFRMFVVCDIYWVCFQQEFTIYITLFYLEPPPEDFTVIP